MPAEPPVAEPVSAEARRQGSEAAVLIKTENEHQLTSILLALSRAVEAEQRATDTRADARSKRGTAR
jgi:hypothetical protein